MFIDIFIKSADIDKWSRAWYQFRPIVEDKKLVYVPVKLLYILSCKIPYYRGGRR